MNPFYSFVAERAAHRCEYCRAPEIIFNVPFEVDHIVPISKSGKDVVDNLALACRSCNLWKSNLTEVVDPQLGETVPLFHPRLDEWSVHFEPMLVPPYRVKGKTAVGRATIKQLKLNKPIQLVARSQWIILGIFP